MITLWGFLLLVIAGVIISGGCILLGAWIMFKAKAPEGSQFIGEPKGEVFNIPDDIITEATGEPSDGEKKLLEKTERFLKVLGGEDGR